MDCDAPEETSLQRPPPPRLCARYFSEAMPSKSIRSLFTNVPPHIVIRSGPSPSQLPLEKAGTENTKKRNPRTSPTQIQNAKRIKSSKITGRRQSKDAAGQRSMNEYIRSANVQDSLETRESMSSNRQLPQGGASSNDITLSIEDATSLTSESARTPTNINWTSVFAKKDPPLCDVHGLPCIELVTKKQGPNVGRRFWICSKPVGPGYDNGKRGPLQKMD